MSILWQNKKRINFLLAIKGTVKKEKTSGISKIERQWINANFSWMSESNTSRSIPHH